MGRTIVALVLYVLSLIFVAFLAMGCFVLAEQWRNWSLGLTYAHQFVGALLALCGLMVAILTADRLGLEARRGQE